jgi:hypothetical protein
MSLLRLKQLNNAASGARADDTASLLHAGLDYVEMETLTGQLLPHIQAKALKCESRGFHHPVLARLLCPAKWLAEFDADPPA